MSATTNKSKSASSRIELKKGEIKKDERKDKKKADVSPDQGRSSDGALVTNVCDDNGDHLIDIFVTISIAVQTSRLTGY